MTINAINTKNPVMQFVYTSTATWSSSDSIIPWDDTIPQKAEGTELFTLAITPRSATSLLEINAYVPVYLNDINDAYTIALFQDAADNALSAGQFLGCYNNGNVGMMHYMQLKHLMVSGTTSATTFKIRLGCNAASLIYVNGNNASRIYGGVQQAIFMIKEIYQ